MEREIGSTFNFQGLGRYPAFGMLKVIQAHGCTECIFHSAPQECGSVREIRGCCTMTSRKDGKPAIFIKDPDSISSGCEVYPVFITVPII